mmetsp:Transcript_2421/g.3510  ORF Transcript_2421/g.3510 Transcript_2421/m.3510 type:complete len:345 (-) Transcript_2421:218-1252(-)|eukprot:CAMPEP_0184487076 /NCGR_PEP_ID=MMETSP0113_2-20130426/9167_1 /TAXON_ID=91329 /ORGANISM="Norrisiella sphaerica, Strain BC52" /LENGTH=344 /DNA_ID=CAMNT_0026869243 /DNA_START=222 /DNA_END=1256 /DNA_ORIENTATION=-
MRNFVKLTNKLNRAAFSTHVRSVAPDDILTTNEFKAKSTATHFDTLTPIGHLRIMSEPKELFRHIDAEPVTAMLGAEVSGVDLSTDISEDVVEEIWNAFLLYGVVFFRGQNLSPAQQVRLAKRFGEVDRHPIVKGMDDHPEVIQIVREAGAPTNFGETWHSDNSYMKEPSLGSILHAVEVPRVGNDTMFSCSYGLYESLSPQLKKILENLKAIHTAGEAFNPNTVSGGSFDNPEAAMKYAKSQELESYALHPMVRTHPETGRKAIFVNSMFTTSIDGMTRSESRPLLDYLFSQVGLPHLSLRYRWKAGDVALWDNRCVQHVAIGDNSSHRRVMRRVTLKGDTPY